MRKPTPRRTSVAAMARGRAPLIQRSYRALATVLGLGRRYGGLICKRKTSSQRPTNATATTTMGIRCR